MKDKQMNHIKHHDESRNHNPHMLLEQINHIRRHDESRKHNPHMLLERVSLDLSDFPRCLIN